MESSLKKVFNSIKPHALVIVAFVFVSFLYFMPNFRGKVHREEDVTQGLLKAAELKKYEEKDGAVPSWTNAIFSGMPSTLILGKPSANQISLYNYLTPFGSTSYPFRILLLSFIGFYILLHAFKIKPLYAALGAMAYGFATYSISSIEAAHYTKVLAMALMPAVLGSIQLLYNRQYFAGATLLAFNLALQTYYFHYQITYYTIICSVMFGVYYFVIDLKKKNLKSFGIATGLAVIASALAMFANIDKIQSTSKFAEETMRGGSALESSRQGKGGEASKTGLKRDYAFAFSYGIGETFTILVPGLYGGSQQEKVSKSSALYEKYEDPAILDNRWNLYHGELGIISGPIYIGAVLIFLFIIGLIIVKDPVKWLLLSITLLSFFLAWGRHFPLLNNFLFDHLPYYNKFRVPMMAMSIAQVSIPLLAFLALKELITERKEYLDILKQVSLTYYILGGFLLILVLIGPSIIDVSGPMDARVSANYSQYLPGFKIDILKEDRASLLRWDSLRSLVFISLTFGLLYFWLKGKLKASYVWIGIGALAVLDVMMVDLRYLSWKEFTHDKGVAEMPEPTEADKQILADKDLYYRVIDMSDGGDPFNNNRGAAFHKMIGGYDPAKLSRYQELISEYIQNDSTQFTALNMLNCKYAIMPTKEQTLVAQSVPGNYGNAWFVNELKQTRSPREEMDMLKKIKPRVTAVIDNSYEDNKKNMPVAAFTPDDSLSSIKLVAYHPDTLTYEVNANGNKYAVFSEIYFPGWKAYVNGKEMLPQKVDYTLRGLSIPQGKSLVKFIFPKQSGTYADTLVLISSVIILLSLLVYIVLGFIRLGKTPAV